MRKILFTILSFLVINSYAQTAYQMPITSPYIRYTGTYSSFIQVATLFGIDTTRCVYNSPPASSIFYHSEAYPGEYLVYANIDNNLVLTNFDSIDFYNGYTIDLDRLDPAFTIQKPQYFKWSDTLSGKIMTRYVANQNSTSLQSSIDNKTSNTTTLTINGVTKDLSANRSWSVGDILSSGSYTNPSWITSLPNTKITYSGTNLQYVSGNGSFITFPTNLNAFTNGPNYITGVTYAMAIAAIGYPPYNGTTNPNNYINSYTETDPLFNTKFTSKTTTDLSEGSNLYYTSARFNTAFGGKTTSDLTEGSGLYYTTARFNASLASKSTSDIAEGGNLYFTNSRSRLAITLTNTGSTGASVYNSTTGVLNVPDYSLPVFIQDFSQARTAVTSPAAANGFQVSTTRPVFVSYGVSIAASSTIALATNVEGYTVLEICPTNSAIATDWKEAGQRIGNKYVSGVAVGLVQTFTNTGSLSTIVPKGWYIRIRNVIVTGVPVFSLTTPQFEEVIN